MDINQSVIASGVEVRQPPVRRILSIPMMVGTVGAVIVVTGLVLLLRERGADRANLPPLSRIKEVPEFVLTERDGRTVTKADLLGYVWIADFIFTTCTGPCPELTLRMRSLQSGMDRFGDRVRLVSFSVDPEFDRPAVLRAYADRHEAHPSRWWFLTCDHEGVMHELVKAGFLQALARPGDGAPIVHSTRFVLVDHQGWIRAWYDGLDPQSKAAILRDIDRLLRESSEP